MEPALHYTDDKVALWHADCRDVLAALPDASVDAVVTDPPYELTSKGGSGGFMGKRWDATGVAFDVDMWAECLRVLKPGGHLLAFGGTRTWHRLAVAIEDAGFEIRDSIAWIFGSGFPKSLDVSKAIDKAAGAEREVVGVGASYGRGAMGNRSRVAAGYRPTEVNPDGGTAQITAPATDAARQWEGWGTALKPAHEPVVCARKPLDGTVAATVIAHGTGALNIDGCRIGDGSDFQGERSPLESSSATRYADAGAVNLAATPGPRGGSPAGRWPANVVVDEFVAAALDEQSGTLTSGANPTRRSSDKFGNAYGEFTGAADCVPARGADAGGASRFFYVTREDQPCPTSPASSAASTAESSTSPRSLPDGSVLEGAATSEPHDTRSLTGSPSTSGTPNGSGPSVASNTPRTASTDAKFSPGQPLAEPRRSASRANSAAPSVPTDTTTTTTGQPTSDGSAAPATFSTMLPPSPGGTRDVGLEAARFKYVAKAAGDERPRHDGVAHPTVKPLDLMRWLVRLVTPPGGTVLEPFAGSGTTVEACLLEGVRCIAVEREAEYLPLTVERVTKRTDPVAHLVHQAKGGADVDLGLFGLLAE